MGGQVVLEQHLVAVAQVEQEQMLEEGEKIRLFEFKNGRLCVKSLVTKLFQDKYYFP